MRKWAWSALGLVTATCYKIVGSIIGLWSGLVGLLNGELETVSQVQKGVCPWTTVDVVGWRDTILSETRFLERRREGMCVCLYVVVSKYMRVLNCLASSLLWASSLGHLRWPVSMSLHLSSFIGNIILE